MKRKIALVLTGLLSMGCFSAAYGAETKVTVDGTPVVFSDAKPFVDENGRTMVPLRPVAKAMGLDVVWDSRSQTATFSETYDPGIEGFGANVDGKQVSGRITYMSLSFEIGSSEVELFGKVELDGDKGTTIVRDSFAMDTKPVVKDGRTYAPLRYMAESFGYSVSWDGAASTVILENYRMN